MSKWLLMFFISFSAVSAAPKVLFLGDSLTAGYGVAKESSYPSVVQQLFGDKVVVVNAGVSGSTTASGKSRLKWFLKSPPQIVVLALGGNDILRGISADESYKNLKNIIELCRVKNIKILLTGMRVPPNYGVNYTKSFEKIYTKLSSKYSLKFIPYLLVGVGGFSNLNQPDGIHPNGAGHKKIARTIYSALKDML